MSTLHTTSASAAEPIARPTITRIVVATDLGGGGLAALSWGRLISQHFYAHLTAVHCEPVRVATAVNDDRWTIAPSPSYEAELLAQLKAHAGPILHGWPCDFAIAAGVPAAAIASLAQERKADLIVAGNSAATGLQSFLGSCTVGIVQNSPCPVLATRTGAPATVERILCPVDLEGTARDSLRLALRFAEVFAAEVMVVHVVEVEDERERMRHERIVREWIAPELQDAVSYRELMLHGPADERLLEYAAASEASLIVIGSRRRHLRQRSTLGTTTTHLLALANAPVLVVTSSPVESPQGRPR